jgi:hypothetical protein
MLGTWLGISEQHAKIARAALNRFKCSADVIIEVTGGVAEISEEARRRFSVNYQITTTQRDNNYRQVPTLSWCQ